MPLYEAVCLKCGAYHEYVRTVATCADTPECCGAKTEKRILTPSYGVQVDIPAYESPATGKWITSRKERREDMKRSGCREWEGMDNEKQEAARQKAYDEEKMDAELDKTVRTAWANLPASQKALVLKEA